LRQEKEEPLDKLWVVQQDKYNLRTNFKEDIEKIWKEKDQLIT